MVSERGIQMMGWRLKRGKRKRDGNEWEKVLKVGVKIRKWG